MSAELPKSAKARIMSQLDEFFPEMKHTERETHMLEELATERAAREEAEKRAEQNLQDADSLDQKYLHQFKLARKAESERDTALARVKELEESNRSLRMTNCVEEADANDQRDRRRAAESALASARARELEQQAEAARTAMRLNAEADELLIFDARSCEQIARGGLEDTLVKLQAAESALQTARELLESWRTNVRTSQPRLRSETDAWLSSHPAPAPAPVADSDCDNCKDEGYALCEHEPVESRARPPSREGREDVSAESSWIDCDHCGGAAVRSETGLFYDGQGDECECCGLPGSVYCDAETPPYWVCSHEPSDRCNRPECEDCNG